MDRLADGNFISPSYVILMANYVDSVENRILEIRPLPIPYVDTSYDLQ